MARKKPAPAAPLYAALSLAERASRLREPPDWLRALDRLYLAPRRREQPDPELSRRFEQGTRGFLWVAYPLVEDVLRRFRERARALPARGAPFDPASAERLVVPHLLDTLGSWLDRVMVLELNVARVDGALAGATPEERFRAFCERLRRRDVRRAIVGEYPVLFRTLASRTASWLEHALELLERLSSDWNLIRARLAPDTPPGHLTSVAMGAGDSHRGGRTVTILEFSSGFRLVYKPHGLAVDAHFGELLQRIDEDEVEAPFRIPRVVDRGRYGWSEFVVHAPCSSREEVERFYRRLGGYLAAFHALRARDMHFENVIAAGEHPVPVDLETSFHGDAIGEVDDPAVRAFRSSVMQVMLLPQPGAAAGADEVLDLSGFGARSDRRFALGSTWSWERPGTDEMRLVRNETAPLIVATNRPTLDGRDVAAGEYVESFLAGFRRVYGWMRDHRAELQVPGGILERFAEDEVRFVARPTATYAELLRPCYHPDRLRDALDRDRALDGLWRGVGQQPHLARLIPAEARDLRGGDVPVFTSRPSSRDLWTSEGERIPEVFERPAMALVREGLERLGDEDLALQERLVRTAIACAGEGAAAGADGAVRLDLPAADRLQPLDVARAVGDLLCREALEDGSSASWIGTTLLGADGRSSIHPLELDLYDGLSGCALFLARLAAVTGEARYERVSRKALALVRRRLQRGRAAGAPVPSLGAFTGLGGIVYVLAHAAVLWSDPSAIEEAKALAADVPALVGSDESLDVIGGSAGAIAALEVLNGVSPGDDLLHAAVLCGERLLRRQQPGGGWMTEVESSRPLTGFSHGAAGIAWALLKLWAWSGEPRFRAAADAAIAYERRTFVAEEGNWPDYRGAGDDGADPACQTAWCHGAPGIALARVDGLTHLDDRETREEIRRALRRTVESQYGRSHGLCHGDLGNLDALLHARQRGLGSWWAEAGERLARATLAGIAARGCVCSAQTSLAPPGLMVGLAGIGYGLLRLACPERVPSVLVLAPPAS